MSEFHCPVVCINNITKHQNADSLSLVKIFDYPCIIKTDDFKIGDLAVYIPVDAMVDVNQPTFSFLFEKCKKSNGWYRIKAAKLRGIFSMGLLIKAPKELKEGDDATEALNIKKYEPPDLAAPSTNEDEKDHGFLPVYTDVEGLRRWPNILINHEEVVATEKIHGANFRAVYHEGRLWVGSHRRIKKPSETNKFWRIAHQYKLEDKLKDFPDFVLYGEVYGDVAHFPYDIPKKSNIRGEGLIIFDILNLTDGFFLDYDIYKDFVCMLDIPTVPVLYHGPWSSEVYERLKETAEEPSYLAKKIGLTQTMEGFVIKPTHERIEPKIRRVIFKYISQQYLLR